MTDLDYQQLGISHTEYDTICRLLQRKPNFTELGIFSVMWSEHCSYKSSRVHLKKLPTTGKKVVIGPGENAGVIDIGNGYGIAFKMESHNHPSFIEPFQGAATGVGGILRDVFTMGARPIATLDALRFGSSDHPKTPFLVKGVVGGISHYGNCIGVATVGGDVAFDSCYNGNILVNAMNIGLVKLDEIFLGRAEGVGNKVLYVGAKTGRDGIHGATMASDVFDDTAEKKKVNVQVGDPFLEKKLLEACLEIMQQDIIIGIQDMGAAGLTSSSVEMASRAKKGVRLDLSRVPTREKNMTPYEMMLSETQERMVMVVAPDNTQKVIDAFQKWDLDAAVIGEVISEPILHLIFSGETYAQIPILALTDEAPVYRRPYLPRKINDNTTVYVSDKTHEEYGIKLLQSPTIANKKWIYQQYDHQVQLGTVIGPGYNGALLRITEAGKYLGAAVACNSRYCELDPFVGAQLAVIECARNLYSVGAVPTAITDCLNFGNPEIPEIMWQFIRSIDGITQACNELDVPVVSGNVSFYNQTGENAIYPTPMIGMVGINDSPFFHCKSNFINENDYIYATGKYTPTLEGSELFKLENIPLSGNPPSIDYHSLKQIFSLIHFLYNKKLINSLHDASEGGFAIALAECCIMNEKQALGAKTQLLGSGDIVNRLFGEHSDLFIFSVSPQNKKDVDDIINQYKSGKNDTIAFCIGIVGGDNIIIHDSNTELMNISLTQAQSVYFNGFSHVL